MNSKGIALMEQAILLLFCGGELPLASQHVYMPGLRELWLYILAGDKRFQRYPERVVVRKHIILGTPVVILRQRISLCTQIRRMWEKNIERNIYWEIYKYICPWRNTETWHCPPSLLGGDSDGWSFSRGRTCEMIAYNFSIAFRFNCSPVPSLFAWLRRPRSTWSLPPWSKAEFFKEAGVMELLCPRWSVLLRALFSRSACFLKVPRTVLEQCIMKHLTRTHSIYQQSTFIWGVRGEMKPIDKDCRTECTVCALLTKPYGAAERICSRADMLLRLTSCLKIIQPYHPFWAKDDAVHFGS